MRNIVLVAVIAMLSTSTLAAEKSAPPSKKSPTVQRPGKTDPCAVYGAGFVQVAGTSTCVKLGGSISVDVKTKVR